MCLWFFVFLIGVVLRCAMLCYACHFTHFSKGCNFSCASHEVPFYIGFPSHAILHMLPINSIFDTFSKKRNVYTLVVNSDVGCVTVICSVMLHCVVLCRTVLQVRTCPCVHSEIKSRID